LPPGPFLQAKGAVQLLICIANPVDIRQPVALDQLLDFGAIAHVNQDDSGTVAFDLLAHLGDVSDRLTAECATRVPQKNKKQGRGLHQVYQAFSRLCRGTL
jgi:hypothetical protein